MALDGRGHQRLDVGFNGHVAANGRHGAAEVGLGHVERVLVAIADHDRRAVGHEPTGRGKADARRAARDHRDLAGQATLPRWGLGHDDVSDFAISVFMPSSCMRIGRPDSLSALPCPFWWTSNTDWMAA